MNAPLIRLEEIYTTSIPVLLDTLAIQTNYLFTMYVLQQLAELSRTKPNDFVQSESLFPALHHILQDPKLNSFAYIVFNILDNLLRIEEAKPILKDKFYKFLEDPRASSSPHKTVLQACLMKAGILQIFDMRTITASEKPQVYSITGHGCVYDRRPPITVPKGVVWIEMEVCGNTVDLMDLSHFINYPSKTFLENTPIPTEKSLQNKYVIDLGNLVGYNISVKFPGQTISDGTNNVFAQMLDDKNRETDRYYKSGIRRLYENMDRSQLSQVNIKVVEHDILGRYLLDDESYGKIYADSIYPTVEQVSKLKPTQYTYTISFKNMFQQIESQEYEPRSPMILIHAGCRVPCVDSLEGPALRRANSVDRKEDLVRTLPIEELLKVDTRGGTYLDWLIKKELFEQASLLVERIDRETSPDTLINYYRAGQAIAIKKIRESKTNSKDIEFQRFLAEKYRAAHKTQQIKLQSEREELAFEDNLKYRYKDGRTELMYMLESEFYATAKRLINRIESRKGSDALAAYLMIQDKSSRSVLTMLDVKDFPPDLRELIISKIPVEMREMIKQKEAIVKGGSHKKKHVRKNRTTRRKRYNE